VDSSGYEDVGGDGYRWPCDGAVIVPIGRGGKGLVDGEGKF